MRQPISAKQGHERRGPRSQPFVKRLESWLTGKGIANQHSGKIDQIVLTKAGTGEAHLLLDGFQYARMHEHVREGCSLSHPGRHGRLRFWRDLDGDRRWSGIQNRLPLLVSSVCCVILSYRLERLLWLPGHIGVGSAMFATLIILY